MQRETWKWKGGDGGGSVRRREEGRGIEGGFVEFVAGVRGKGEELVALKGGRGRDGGEVGGRESSGETRGVSWYGLESQDFGMGIVNCRIGERI